MSVNILHGLTVPLLLQSGLLPLPLSLPLPLLPLSSLLVESVPLPLFLVPSLPENLMVSNAIIYIILLSGTASTDQDGQTLIIGFTFYLGGEY